jgi:hypothetical protein
VTPPADLPVPDPIAPVEPVKKKRFRYVLNLHRVSNKNCNECYVDNGREYDEDDPTRPKFPRHHLCGCGEIEIEVSV